MEGIEFEKENYRPITPNFEPQKKSWAINLVMKLSGGHIKNENQASIVLIVFVVLLIIFTIYNLGSSPNKIKGPTHAEVLEQQKKMDEQMRGTAPNNL